MTILKEFDFFLLLRQFVADCENGKILKKDGTMLRPGSIQNYKNLRTLLLRFKSACQLNIKVKNLSNCSEKEMLKEKKYWKRIYLKLTKFMYRDCNHFDNYVGANMKLLRSFFNYLTYEKGIETKSIQKIFYTVKEEIPIVVLNSDQLNFLINDSIFEERLPVRLKKAKDIFVFGCIVGLRISDLLSLTQSHIEKSVDRMYLKIFSKKTSSHTRVTLPEYAVRILAKYKNKYSTLLPKMCLNSLNKYLREICHLAGWTYPIEKIRRKRGRVIRIKRDSKHTYRFCDLVSSHTMRRTAITLCLSHGMPEQLVRRLSGHTPGSKEFFRYVKFSEEIFDKELEKVHSKFLQK